MKLATTDGDFLNYVGSHTKAAELFEGTGFKHIDMSFYNAHLPGSPMLGDNWMDDIRGAAATAERLGLDFVQAHSPGYNPFDESADHSAGMLATLRSIEACGFLGIKNIVVHPGYSSELKRVGGESEFFRRNREFYLALAPSAERFGVNLLAENSAEGNMGDRYFPFTADDMLRLIDYIGSPLVHACWDVGHANMRGADQYKELTALGSELRAVHIQDNFGALDEHIAPLCGTLDLDSVLQGLEDADYHGYFTFECDNLLLRGGGWPHRRTESPVPRARKLASPNSELRRDANRLLYQIGKFALEQYGRFED